MLQKAIGGGHSWWWASHIRTKQSKWLELNLQDMDMKVDHVLNLIQNDGDSFARRAEMYYRHRPDVISFIEETLRAYRALAERYDKLSGDLQKANTTIASICPEKVDLSLDEDDDDFNYDSPKTPKLNRQNRIKIPKSPKPVNKDVNCVLDNASKTIEATKTSEEKENQSPLKSGLTKDDALEEIDNLQKQILEMETLKDSMKNYYENSLAEYWDAETQIIENQQRICRLEDEYEICKKIEEDNKGTLMAEEALKSCQETLAMLQDHQKKLRYDVKLEHQRFDQAKQKLKSIKQKYNSESDLEREQEQEQELEIRNVSNQSLEGVSKNPEKITELADTIDTLVNMVITLESSISSQTVLADMLRKEADDLQSQIRKMEDDMQTQAQKFENDLQTQTQKMEDELQTQIQKMEDEFQTQIQKMEDEFQTQIQKIEDELPKESDHTCVCNETAVESKSEEKNIDISWQSMLLNGIEDKDKIILEEYITILRHYKDTKKKLSEEQKINQGLKQKLRLVQENIPHEDESKTTIDEEAQAFSAMDMILDENVNFWLRFSTAFHQVHKFKTQIEDLNDEIKKVKSRSDIKLIYKNLKDIKSKLTIWLEESMLLKDELRMRFAYLSNIEEGIKFSSHEEAAKFQGEIMKKKQEHNEISKELEASLDHVVAIKLELEKTLERVEKEFGLLKNPNQQQKGKLSSSKSIIPLKSFLFGVKSKTQKSSFFSCMSSPKKSRSKKGGCMSI
ncbi:unnamed protein product [Lactuca saligna]|uniref:NAB domain-containing protein n=1 Tax=Lactuca saligna TaxID=75948 RepID=A0AA35VI14_LACSI|nr:unnamed protein product [Lactuca saligna]